LGSLSLREQVYQPVINVRKVKIFLSYSVGLGGEIFGVPLKAGESFRGVRKAFRDVAWPFRGVREAFRGVARPFRGAREAFRDVAWPFRGVREAFRDVAWPFRGVREAFRDLAGLFRAPRELFCLFVFFPVCRRWNQRIRIIFAFNV